MEWSMAMHQTPETTHGRTVGGRYLELIHRFFLRPINSDEELDMAIDVINSLLDQETLDQGEADYLDVLGDLVEKYETEHHPIPPVSDSDRLRHLIEAKGTTQAKLADDTGISESTFSAIFRGKRRLNRRHIEVLARYFHVSPSVFIS
jgi:HTH-type transcriptional regulator / antitoxin HigA